jgi:NDP-sugar pyrophosphorylase family protein
MFKPTDLFDLSQTAHAELFDGCEHGWDALKKLKGYIDSRVRSSPHSHENARVFIGPDVVIGEGTVIEDGVMIKGPAIIGKNCEIRHNAYIREHVIIGDHCIIGNACEFKHSLLFNHSVVPHFSYVGDSILGYKSHLGAGVKISNVKLMPGNVTVLKNDTPFDTGLRKFGALLGDFAEIGCNSVLNPGSIIGRNSVVYPCTNWRGFLPEESISKNLAEREVISRRTH